MGPKSSYRFHKSRPLNLILKHLIPVCPLRYLFSKMHYLIDLSCKINFVLTTWGSAPNNTLSRIFFENVPMVHLRILRHDLSQCAPPCCSSDISRSMASIFFIFCTFCSPISSKIKINQSTYSYLRSGMYPSQTCSFASRPVLKYPLEYIWSDYKISYTTVIHFLD
jgi:hypothetical protein